MHYLLSLFLFLLPGMLQAQQPSLHLGFNTGIIFNQLNFNNDNNATVGYNSDNINVWLGLKAWRQTKHLQVGLAVETGLIRESIDYTIREYRNNTLVNEVVAHTRFDLLSPAVSPMSFVHYTLNLSPKAYMYAGPALGVIIGYNSLDKKNKIAFAGGINMGISFSISKHARFEIAHGWRMARVNMSNGVQYIQGPDAQGNSLQYTIPDFTLQCLTNSIGLVMNL